MLKMLDNYKPIQKKIMQHYLDGFKIEEISKLLKISRNSILITLRFLKNEYKRFYDKDGYELDKPIPAPVKIKYKHSQETKRKMSESKKGNKYKTKYNKGII